MKVCTDACILGAWVATKITNDDVVLDIGTGTGLLIMMLAQKSTAKIHGIEIDRLAFEQAKENIAQTDWKNRIEIFYGDVRSFIFPVKYNFIICNPPFYENDLASENRNEQVAKHSKELSLVELIKAIDKNLSHDGSFFVLLPYHRVEFFDALCKTHQFFLMEKLLIKQTASHGYFRAVMQYSRNRIKEPVESELTIKENNGGYSASFIELLKDYYLYL